MSHARRTRRLGSVNTRRGGRWEKARLGLGAAAERTLEDGSAVNQVSGPGHASRVGVPRVNTRIWHDILSPSFPRASHPCKSTFFYLSSLRVVSENPLASTSRIRICCQCFVFVLLDVCLFGLGFPQLFEHHVSPIYGQTPCLTDNHNPLIHWLYLYLKTDALRLLDYLFSVSV